MEQLVKELSTHGEVKTHEPLKKYTTWKIGGPASVVFSPRDITSLEKAMQIITREQVEWFVIGKGSNLLVSDKGFVGVVITLNETIRPMEIEGATVTVSGGYPLIKLATIASRNGLGGLEFAGGIPGTVGGAVFMNAGAHGSDMSSVVKKVRVLYPDGTFRWLDREDLDYSYRTSILQKDPGICVEAVLELTAGDKEQLKAILQRNKDYRRHTQPWNFPCCGSVFRNPLPNHAGKLIEEAGLKGHTIGGAQVSEMHANFIVNKSEASCEDVLALIAHVKKTIKKRNNVDLITEVEVVGQRA
ncbi:UDP-N-acetylmuramate dehydrogenase [Alteribacter aurantiacus]|uniref:UDP-N-acetylmuramate dehydrogenase n=1 Tax=Alteribacter aurantiacus TaxID=254410 RepID=UPI000412A8D3|nr:UDP-N-acetylmuramate dehydrogenase [Alteribacter aurantiacus]